MLQAQRTAFNGFADFQPQRARPLASMIRILLILFVILLAIAVAGRWLGGLVSAGGHSESRMEREFVVGSTVLHVPQNMIRSEEARGGGVQKRLDLYLRWPQLDGYSRQARDQFNHAGGDKSILFLSFEPRTFARDMSDRLELVYERLIVPRAARGPAELSLYRFRPETGYSDEILVVGRRPPEPPFVARCLSGELAARSLASCERDVNFGEDLSLIYRFPEELLADWRRLDAAVQEKAATLLKTGGV